MGFDRAALKLKARQSMSGRRPSAILVSLVYLLLTMGLSVVVVLVLLQPFVNLMLTAALTEVGDRELLRMLASYLPFWLIGLALGVVVTLFSYVMSFGYQGYVLQLARGQEAGWRELMGGFSSLGRALGVYLMVGIFSALWYLVAYVPVTLVMLVWESVLNPAAWWLAVPVELVLNVAVSVFYVSRVLRYSLAPLALADQPELGVFGAIRRSKELMQGRRWEFFKLNLSFLGWYLIEVLVVLAGYWVSIVAITFLAGFGLWGGWRSQYGPNPRAARPPDRAERVDYATVYRHSVDALPDVAPALCEHYGGPLLLLDHRHPGAAHHTAGRRPGRRAAPVALPERQRRGLPL